MSSPTRSVEVPKPSPTIKELMASLLRLYLILASDVSYYYSTTGRWPMMSPGGGVGRYAAL
eukprot:806451-Prymnesium_polylepis.1